MRLRYTLIPSVNERLSGNGRTIREGLAFLNLDREVLRIFSLDRFGEVVLRGAVCIVVDEACVDQVNNLAATGFVGVGRDERVLRFGAVCYNNTATGLTLGRVRAAVTGTAGAGGQRKCRHRKGGD